MASKVKTNEAMIVLNMVQESEDQTDQTPKKNESIIDIANDFLKSKQAEGIPVTESFRKLFILNYLESKNLELSWRKTRGN